MRSPSQISDFMWHTATLFFVWCLAPKRRRSKQHYSLQFWGGISPQSVGIRNIPILCRFGVGSGPKALAFEMTHSLLFWDGIWPQSGGIRNVLILCCFGVGSGPKAVAFEMLIFFVVLGRYLIQKRCLWNGRILGMRALSRAIRNRNILSDLGW